VKRFRPTGQPSALSDGERATHRGLLLAALVAALAAASVFLLPGAQVAGAVTPCSNPNVLSGSNFEIDTDANLKVDGPGDCIDWLAGGSGSAMRSGVLVKNDKPSGTTDDSFGQGSQENDANPTIVAGSIPPNKSDLKTFGLFPEVTQTGKFLALFWTRINSPQGDTNMDFELNQKFCDPSANPTNCANNGAGVTPETPVRTTGDKLITYDLSNGGNVPTISIRTWTGSVWGPATDVSASGQALGSINDSAIAAADSGGLGDLDSLTFGEAIISFDAIFPNSDQCGALGSAYLKSRSSDSFQSEIKDFISPEQISLTNCTALTTTAQNSVTLGQPIFDVAHLTGSTLGAGGTITFHLFSDAKCQNEISTGLTPVTVNGDADYNSGNFTPSAPGTYYWTATYSGDQHNKGFSTTCGDANESSTVNKATPSISTVVKDSNGATVDNGANKAALGTTVHDTATLSGQVDSISFDGTATVTYTLYSNLTCTAGVGNANVLDSGNKAVVAPATVPDSNAFGPLGSGDYSYQAVYNGNANYNSATGACEPFHVNKATPSISTVVKDSNGATVDNGANKAALGTTVHDTATLSGQVDSISFDGTATVTYTLYSNLTCTAGVGNANVLDSGNKAVVAPATVPDSNAFGPLGSGDYSYQAVYNGNANYNSATGACEPFHVNKATPGMTTTVKDGDGNVVDDAHPAALGAKVHDTSVLLDKVDGFSFDGTATVTYTFFTSHNCTTGAGTPESVTVASDGSVPDSSETDALGAGTYSYEATYNGNADYTPKTSVCEPFSVGKATPSITTTLKNAADDSTIDNGSTVDFGSSVYDTAALGNKVEGLSFDGTATVTYAFFHNNTCEGEPFSTEDVNVAADGSVPQSSTKSSLEAGDYAFQATYNGNDNYFANTSDCEPFTVAKAKPTIATSLSDSLIRVGGTVHDSSSLSGASSDAGGTVTYAVYTDSACTQDARDAGTVDVTNGSVPDSNPLEFDSAGTFYWQAVYSGDDNNEGATSACTDETLRVISPHITILKSPDQQTIVSGQTATFTIQVINDGDSTLTDVTVTDAQAPGCARTKADIPGLASMPPAPAAGSTITYQCTLANVTSSFTNSATATGQPPVGPPVSSTDTAGVTVVPPVTHPAVQIVKDPKSQTVTKGNTATFTITVLNTGDVALTDVVVTDALSPNCNKTIGTLAPGQSVSYKCTRPNVQSSFTNVAVVTGKAGGTTVTDQDTAPVTAKAPFVPKVVPKVVSHKKPKATG
jgi:uncharacterized repeat protein (TIGR01451 family)